MASAKSITEKCRSNGLVSAAVVVAALYFGRDILLPFAISVLLSFLLAPLVERLETWKFGRILSVLTIVSVAIVAFTALAMVLAQQVYDLAYNLPDYKENIVAKVQTFQGDGTGVLSRVTKSVDDMRAMLAARPGEHTAGYPPSSDRDTEDVRVDDSSDQAKQPQLGNDVTKPVPVEVVESLSANEIAQGILGPLISPLASIAMVVVLLIFMLLKREDLRNRFIYLIGGGHLYLTTQALTDAAAHVGAMSTF